MTPEPPATNPEQQLAELADELIERMRLGEAIDERALLEQYPQFQTQLTDMLATIHLVAEIGTPKLQVDAPMVDSAQTEGGEPSLGSLGDFRLCREIGRGGMGVVYEALQRSLNRHVALKVLPFAAVLDARQLARFKNEAQAAAALSHPHIVPVYGVGCERGVHYYAMQLVQGQTLAAINAELQSLHRDDAEAVSEQVSQITWELSTGRFDVDCEADGGYIPEPDEVGTPADLDTKPFHASAIATERTHLIGTGFFRTIAQLGIQAAEALQHAHEHGVIHRDIKPGNLMLDETGHLWITDFGLAHLESSASVTLSGDVLGTLRYMSPEQARVQPGVVDHRSDIYSLGVTLYEMLTQHRALPGETRQELLRQIGDLEPHPPTKHNPAVPSELETIVLKAMRKTPGERYATASDLADDLQRFLDSRPIHAKPPKWSEIALKWGQRNRKLVIVAACGLFLAVITLAVSNWRVARQRDAATQAFVSEQRQSLKATRQEQRAVKTSHLALQAINEMLHRIGGEGLKNVPMMQEVRVDLTKRAVTLLEQLDELEVRDERIQFQIGCAYRQLGRLQRLVGQQTAAETSAHKAIAVFRKLSLVPNSSIEIRQKLMEAYRSLADTLRDLGKFDEAIQTYEQAESTGEPLRNHPAVKDAACREIALIRGNRALSLVEMGAPDAAEKVYMSALECARELVNDDASVENLNCVGTIQYNLSGLYLKQENWQEAETQALDAVATFSAISHGPRLDAQIQMLNWLAVSHGHLGVLYYRTSRLDEAAQAYGVQIQTLTKLAKDFPSIPSYRHEAAVGRGNLASVLRAQGNARESGNELTAAISVLRTLVADYPDVHMYREHLADFQFNAGNRSLGLDEPEAAIEYYTSGYEAYQQLSSLLPDREDLRESVAVTKARLGIAYHKTGNATAGDASYRQAIEGYQTLAETSNNPKKYLLGAASILWKFGDDLCERGAVAEGEQAFEDSTKILDQLSSNIPDDTTLQSKLARQYALLAIRLSQQSDGSDRNQKVLRAFERSVELAGSLAENQSEGDKHRSLLSSVQCNYAITLGDLGFEKKAWEVFQASSKGPAPPQLHSAISWFLSTCKDNSLRDEGIALKQADAGTEAITDNSFSWTALALAQHRAGRPEAAEKSIARAFEFGGQDSARASAVAALISVSEGQTDRCRSFLQKAGTQIQSDPGPHTTVVRRLIAEAQSELKTLTENR